MVHVYLYAHKHTRRIHTDPHKCTRNTDILCKYGTIFFYARTNFPCRFCLILFSTLLCIFHLVLCVCLAMGMHACVVQRTMIITVVIFSSVYFHFFSSFFTFYLTLLQLWIAAIIMFFFFEQNREEKTANSKRTEIYRAQKVVEGKISFQCIRYYEYDYNHCCNAKTEQCEVGLLLRFFFSFFLSFFLRFNSNMELCKHDGGGNKIQCFTVFGLRQWTSRTHTRAHNDRSEKKMCARS